MPTKLLAVVFAAVACLAGLILWLQPGRAAKPSPAQRSHPAAETRTPAPSVNRNASKPAPSGVAAPTGRSTSIETARALAALEPPRPPAPEVQLAALPRRDLPIARVNGVDLTPATVFPPGVMSEGDQMPKAALDKFIEDAVNRAVVVQEAERRGFAETSEFLQRMEELRKDIDDLPNLSPEEREWQITELRDRALMDLVYRAEGILPRRISEEELASYYAAHAPDYDWVRKREALKNASEEKIERRIREEIRKDLMIPVKRDYTAQREALSAGLRQNGRVEILVDRIGVPD